MQGIKSPEGRWSVSLCGCSEETADFPYGHVIVHIPRDDLRDLAMQNVAEDAARSESRNRFEFKKGLVQ
jgi:hypothetical protein